MPKFCKHENFDYHASMLMVGLPGTDRLYPMIELSARCSACGEDYVFIDLETKDVPEDQIRYCAHSSVDGTRAYLPVAIAGSAMFERQVIN